MFVFLTNYLSSHSIIVVGAQLIQIQSLICREEHKQDIDAASASIYSLEHIQVLSRCATCCVSR